MQHLRLQELKLKEQKLKLVHELPHRYGFPFYKWARQFYESTNRLTLLCAANQIGKSSTQIRRMIELATNQELWPKYWKQKPNQFWYLYPSRDVATAEYLTKWQEFLPRGSMKDHPVYGWREVIENKRIHCIRFNSGVAIYFKTYAQDVQTLQSGTVYYIACFVAGTKILTRSGSRPIEEIREGDEVLSQNGWRKVSRTLVKENADVITRKFSNGKTITATLDHPFWTENRGWVDFSELTPADQCGTVPEWKLIENLSFLRGSFTRGIANIKTRALEIISRVVASFCTLPFGSRITKQAFQRGMSSTTRAETLTTTAFPTLSYSHESSTHDFTRWRNGEKRRLTPSSAINAEKVSSREVQRLQFLDSVLRSAESWLVEKIISVSFAVKNFLRVPILKPVTVQSCAPIATKADVYNLTVSDCPTFFAEGISVHNCDEELPEDLWDELQLRTAAVDGLVSIVFTATLGQELWHRAIEGHGKDEAFPDALKIQVSMYDCMYYEDGSVGNYDESKIHRIKQMCKSDAEIQRRVYGRFVKDSGRVYQSFDPMVHYVKNFELNADHKIYTGVDIGGGGEGHPAAITFVACNPEHTKGWVFRFWRGDGVLTTASDVLQKYREMRGNLKPIIQSYDFQAKDFGTISQRMGEPFTKAEKSHEIGEGVFNALFKNNALFLVDQGDEIRKLGMELMSLQEGERKNKAKDDGIDSCRYAIVRIPWNWEEITKHSMPTFEEKMIVTRHLTEAEYRAWEIDERRGVSKKSDTTESWQEIDAEFEHWNNEYGN